MPFGVDTEFFTPPTDDPPVEWDIAAVGTNEGKDFPTLVSALSPHERCLIVTDQRNAGQVRRTETQGAITLEHDIPILQLRALYLAARRIVVPLKHVDFSSGQTVLLETLALGRPVVVTDVLPVRDYVSPEVATLVPPGDVTSRCEQHSTSPYRLVCPWLLTTFARDSRSIGSRRTSLRFVHS